MMKCYLICRDANWSLLRYPADLKARITGPQGHLSNSVCAETAVKLVNSGMKHLVLMHLSEENNTPAKAETMVFSKLEDYELAEDCCEVISAPRYGLFSESPGAQSVYLDCRHSLLAELVP